MSDRLFPEAKQAVDQLRTDIKKGRLGEKPLFKLEKKYFKEVRKRLFEDLTDLFIQIAQL